VSGERGKDTERQEQREETYLQSEDTVAGRRVKTLENTCQKGLKEVINMLSVAKKVSITA